MQIIVKFIIITLSYIFLHQILNLKLFIVECIDHFLIIYFYQLFGYNLLLIFIRIKNQCYLLANWKFFSLFDFLIH